ncbi:hypothetical protein CR513_33934, partial [Mucuna pruriens]
MGKSKEKNHDDDDDHVITATGDDLRCYTACYTKESDFGVLKMRNDGVSKMIGVSDVCLQTNIGV